MPGPVTTSMGDRLRAGIPSPYVTSQLGQLSLASLRGRLIEYQLRLGKGGNVTSAGWQVTLCDPTWHVSSRSGVATLGTAIHLLLVTYTQAHRPRTRDVSSNRPHLHGACDRCYPKSNDDQNKSLAPVFVFCVCATEGCRLTSPVLPVSRTGTAGRDTANCSMNNGT